MSSWLFAETAPAGVTRDISPTSSPGSERGGGGRFNVAPSSCVTKHWSHWVRHAGVGGGGGGGGGNTLGDATNRAPLLPTSPSGAGDSRPDRRQSQSQSHVDVLRRSLEADFHRAELLRRDMAAAAAAAPADANFGAADRLRAEQGDELVRLYMRAGAYTR